MERSNRLLAVILHLVARGRNRKAVFHSDQDRWDYLNLLQKYSKKLNVLVLAWVLMGNHVHLLVQCEDEETGRELLRLVNSYYARRFNWRHQRSGAVWETRPKRELVAFSDYFRNCQLYIELNPVKADLAKRAERYEWSSCRFHCTGKEDGLTAPSPWIAELGRTDLGRRRAYRRLLEEARRRDWRRGSTEEDGDPPQGNDG